MCLCVYLQGASQPVSGCICGFFPGFCLNGTCLLHTWRRAAGSALLFPLCCSTCFCSFLFLQFGAFTSDGQTPLFRFHSFLMRRTCGGAGPAATHRPPHLRYFRSETIHSDVTNIINKAPNIQQLPISLNQTRLLFILLFI